MRFLTSLLLAGVVTACAPKTSTITDDTGSGSGSSGGGDTIFDIQNGTIGEDADVTLTDVVVTSGLTSTEEGFFIQEPGGGEYSGIYVYLQGGADDLYLSPGDEITVTGVTTEYYDWTELVVSSPTAIQVTGEAEITVDSVGEVSDWEPWESCLISLGASTVQSVDSYGEALLDAGLEMDDLFYTFSTESGATYSDVIGLVGYSYSEWKLYPRDESDLQGYTEGEVVAATVADVQQGNVAGQVTIEGAVVTSAMSQDGEGFFIQDSGGGEWSGVYVWSQDMGDLSVSVGDVVNVTGSGTEYYDLTELVISDGSAVEIVSSGASVTADSVDPSSVSDWEAWEGCLLNFGSATVTSEEDYGEYGLDLGMNIDDHLTELYVSVGDEIDPLTGILHYSYEAWKILPRDSGDLGGEGGGEPAAATVMDIQSGGQTGTVTLSGVVVTSPVSEDGFYVQDSGGGAWSGLYIYASSGTDGLSLSEGDVVEMTGQVTEYYDLTELVISDGSAVSVMSSGAAVTVDEVDPGTVSDWEPWESCLINLGAARVELVEDYGEFALDLGLNLDDYFYSMDLSKGQSLTQTVGLLGYSYSEWKLYPRSASDLGL